MKALFILIIPFYLFSNELKWVDQQIDAIKPPRVGIIKSEVHKVPDPFIFLKNKPKKKSNKKSSKSKRIYSKKTISKNSVVIPKINFSVDAIINKSAFINGKWYKLGSKIGSFTISDIERTRVELSFQNKVYFLSTEKKEKKLKFNNN